MDSSEKEKLKALIKEEIISNLKGAGSILLLILVFVSPFIFMKFMGAWPFPFPERTVTSYWSCDFPGDEKEYVMIKGYDAEGKFKIVCIEGKPSWRSGLSYK